MRNAVVDELTVLGMDAERIFGAAFTPRHQGPGERGHQTMLINEGILLHAVFKAFPQEWTALLPAVEYLHHTAPQSTLGFSAHDMSSGYSLLHRPDKRLAPFRVPRGAAETDIAAGLFDNFRELYTLFVRITQDERFKDQLRINQHRYARQLEVGETV